MTIEDFSFRLKDVKVSAFVDAELKIQLFFYDGTDFIIMCDTKKVYTESKKKIQDHLNKEEK